MIQRVLFEKCPNCPGWKYNLYGEMEDKTGEPMGSHSLGSRVAEMGTVSAPGPAPAHLSRLHCG